MSKIFHFEWQACNDRTDIDVVSECMPLDQQQRWLKQRDIEAFVIYSHNFVDYAAYNEPVKFSASTKAGSRLQENSSLTIKVPMNMH